MGRLAGAVKNRVQTEGVCEVDTVGPEALHKALKAVIMAGRYLQDEALAGSCLAFSPAKVPLAARSAEEPATSMVRLRVRLLPAPPPKVPEEGPELLLAGGETNPGMLATDLAARLRGSGSATVGGMGAVATSRAIKAQMIAKVYLAKMLGSRKELLAVPQLEVLEVNGQERWRMVLNCLVWDENLQIL